VVCALALGKSGKHIKALLWSIPIAKTPGTEPSHSTRLALVRLILRHSGGVRGTNMETRGAHVRLVEVWYQVTNILVLDEIGVQISKKPEYKCDHPHSRAATNWVGGSGVTHQHSDNIGVALPSSQGHPSTTAQRSAHGTRVEENRRPLLAIRTHFPKPLCQLRRRYVFSQSGERSVMPWAAGNDPRLPVAGPRHPAVPLQAAGKAKGRPPMHHALGGIRAVPV